MNENFNAMNREDKNLVKLVLIAFLTTMSLFMAYKQNPANSNSPRLADRHQVQTVDSTAPLLSQR